MLVTKNMVEVAFIDCWEGRLGPAELPRGTQVAIYCGKRDTFTPPREATLLEDFDLSSSTALALYFLFVDNDIELGYRLSQLSKHQLTLYTPRPASFQSLRLHIEACVDESISIRQTLVEALEEKMKAHVRETQENVTNLKESSILAILANFAQGLVVSYKSRNQGRTDLPVPEELAAIAYGHLAAQGLFTPRARSPVQNSLNVIRKESLAKFLDKLQQGSNRPQKYQQVVNTLANFLDGGIIAVRSRLGSSMPDSKPIAQEMLGRVVDTKAIMVSLGKVTYNDEKMQELGRNKELLDWVAIGGIDPRQSLANIEEAKLVAVKIQSAAANTRDLTIGDLLSLYNRLSDSHSNRKAVLNLLLTQVFEPPSDLSPLEIATSPENYSRQKLQLRATPR